MKKHLVVAVFLTAVVAFVTPYWFQSDVARQAPSPSSAKADSAPPSVQRAAPELLNVSVLFTGTEFLVVNRSGFDCRNTLLAVNPSFASDGFTHRLAKFRRNQMYAIGAMRFQKNNGTLFNPFAIEPASMKITCEDAGGVEHEAYEIVRAAR